MNCPHCQQPVFQASSEKLKARTKILVVHKNGSIETGCPHCKRGVLLPFELSAGSFEIKKAPGPSLVILDRKGTAKP